MKTKDTRIRAKSRVVGKVRGLYGCRIRLIAAIHINRIKRIRRSETMAHTGKTATMTEEQCIQHSKQS